MKTDKILLDHGSGGKVFHHLLAESIIPVFNNPILAQQNDGAIIEVGRQRLAFSTDSYVVDPIFFPGGNIGDLAVYGTVNDLAMCGAKPLFLSVGLIIEEGFPMEDLARILRSMAEAAAKAGVQVVTGDTKVVPKGAVDKLFINTSGIGVIADSTHIAADQAKPGDQIILSGTIADHGVAILAAREGLRLTTAIQSDTAPLNHMVEQMLAAAPDVHVLRDPTRGGLATALKEIALQSGVGIKIREAAIPLQDPVKGVCELLGLDPLFMANEGKLLAFVGAEGAEAALAAMRENEFGRRACLIGEVLPAYPGEVLMQTRIGGLRIIDMLTGEQLPRIC